VVFDVCSDCVASPYEGALLIAVLWLVPTVLYVVRHQLSPQSRFRRFLLMVVSGVSLAIAPATLYQLRILDGERSWYDASIRLAWLANGAALALVLVAALFRWMRRPAEPA
jgi:hypothetical protein